MADASLDAVAGTAKPLSPTARVLLAGALLTSAWIWWRVALPVLAMEGKRFEVHAAHAGPLLAHAGGGTLMLAAGFCALVIGLTRNAFRWHKWFGYAYDVGGGAGALAALGLAVWQPHHNPGNSAATGTLAAVWLAIAFFAWRAARNRRFDAHRSWMIRSYVLTWTFVLCRIVQDAPFIAGMGDEVETATIWASWIVPLVVCDMALQWRAASRRGGNT